MNDAVCCVIPGARRVDQIEENVKATELAPLPSSVMGAIEKVHQKEVRKLVHDYW